jgi:hypothetical protein
MLTGLTALENTDWSRLHHAYGPATDTPDHLRALLTGDVERRKNALSHLWSAIIHQGTPWTATGPVALVVAGLLSDERIDQADESIRANLLSFLVSVVEASVTPNWTKEELDQLMAYDLTPLIDSGDDDTLYGDEDAANAFYARSILGCARVAPVLMEVMLEGLSNPEPRVRACAAMGAAKLVQSGPMQSYRNEVESRLMEMARTADTDERSAHVLALGECGISPRAFLSDPSPAVRMCAALAPSLATDPTALAELIEALKHAHSIDSWFVERPPQFSMRPRFAVVKRIVEQVTEFERLVDAAVAVAGITSKYCVDNDWGPLLAAAFPDGKGIVTSEAQRRFLGALVKKAELWDRTNGNAYKWFERAGLPYDRLACEKRASKV